MNVLGETLAVRQADQSRCGENPENGSHEKSNCKTQKNLSKNFLLGEKMTNMRSGLRRPEQDLNYGTKIHMTQM